MARLTLRSRLVLKWGGYSFLLAFLLLSSTILGRSAHYGTPRVQSLDGTWNLWFDTKANWKHEKLVLNQHDLKQVPRHPPTIGWNEMLKAGKPFPVPGTWDEVYPMHHGVGWEWRNIWIPKSARGKCIRIRFSAVRLRAEVYLNRKLVGYNLEGYVPFAINITSDVHYGANNLLAVRVTNPGGGHSWMDFVPIRWGNVLLPDSHDFGGIWQNVDLLMTPRTFIKNVFIAPLADLKTIRIYTTIQNQASKKNVQLQYSVYDEANDHRPIARGHAQIVLLAHAEQKTTIEITIPDPKLWSPETPHLYKLVTRLSAAGSRDKTTRQFGIRFFTEKNGKLFLNGHRIFIISSINFGYYPNTVAFPTPSLAANEVRAAKTLGLNTLSCHRTACTPALLDAADRLGLMIYEEPGGAPRDLKPGPPTPAEAFERQVFLDKLVSLVQRDRNHPSLVWWNMANEAFQDVVNDPRHLNPYINELMRTTHHLDPSRFVTYTSARQSTVMFRPFAKNYGLIYDYHTVNNVPAVWRDVLTLDESRFRAPVPQEAFYNGESRCLTSLGDLPTVARKFAKAPKGSYGAMWRHWNKMLDRQFRQYGLDRYFQTPENLCRLIGLQQGEGFSQEVQSARLSDAASGLAINGWISHPEQWDVISASSRKKNFPAWWTSGLVDPFRDFNFPPQMLSSVCKPTELAVIPIPSTAYSGEKIRVRITFVNEGMVKGPGRLTLRLTAPDGSATTLEKMNVIIQARALKFVQNLPTYHVRLHGQSGFYKLDAKLRLPDEKYFKRETSVLMENPTAWKIPQRGITLEDPTNTLSKYFEAKDVDVPNSSSPMAPWQPVEMIYNSKNLSQLNLKPVSQEGKTLILWATDAARGKVIVKFLQGVKLLPNDSAALPLGLHWFGGWNFDTPHPIFAGLPAPTIFDQYFASAFAYWGITDFPGELIAGMINAPPQVAVTLGELHCGKGKVMVCALNLLPYLDKDPVGSRIFAQLLEYAVHHANVSAEQLRQSLAGPSYIYQKRSQ